MDFDINCIIRGVGNKVGGGWIKNFISIFFFFAFSPITKVIHIFLDFTLRLSHIFVG